VVYDIRNCKQIHDHGNRESGIYKVYSSNQRKLTVYCDMDTDGGGWTVFQRREDGSVNFYRNWKEYRTGFGEPDQEFWMGEDNLHYLSGEEKYELRVEMRNCVNVTKYAQYRYVEYYKIHIYSVVENNNYIYSGNSLAIHNGQPFSAYDNDQDIYGSNCAFRDKGAWWYKGCHHANLNGLYQPCKVAWTSASWYSFDDEHQGLRFIEMKVRPL
uniref:Fibrinogen C-terminal domain-containing protein n=1 Tax=Ciona intestinalis TaxID=7719 RepID=H2XRG5_CIOIN